MRTGVCRWRNAQPTLRLSVDEIAGLMLYSIQNKLPMPNDTYGGKQFAESGMKAYDLSDAQIKFLTDDNLRHVLVSTVESPETAARWNNKVQALIEGRTHGIPANRPAPFGICRCRVQPRQRWQHLAVEQYARTCRHVLSRNR